MTSLIASLDAHRYLQASMTACSWKAGWRSLLLRAYVDPPTVEEFCTPATADQLLVLVTGGSCDLEAKYRGRWQRARYDVGHIGTTGAGDAVSLRWRGDSPHTTLQLHLPEAAIRRSLHLFTDRDPSLVVMPSQILGDDPLARQVMLSLADAMEAGVPDLYAESARELLIAHLLTRYVGLSEPAGADPARVRLRRVDEFVRANLERPLSLDAIAREAGLSRFHTLRLFKRVYGETPVRRVTRLRMERARKLLESGGETITAIASLCGYEESAHFAAAFRRWVGVSPRQYRARCGSNSQSS